MVSGTAVFIFNFSIYLCFVLALCRILRAVDHLWALSTIIIIATCSMLFCFTTLERLYVSVAILIVSLALKSSFLSKTAFVMAGLLGGLSLLMKVNDAVILLALFYILLGFSALRGVNAKRYARVLILGVLPIAGFLFGYAASGAPFSAVSSYFRYSLQMVSGYSEAMSIIGPEWQIVSAILGLLIVFVLIPLVTPGRIAYLLYAAGFVFAFAAFKHCMVRQDGHGALFHIQLALASLFALIAATNVARRWALIAFGLVNLALGIGITQQELPNLTEAASADAELRHFSRDLYGYSYFERAWNALGASIEQNLRPLDAAPHIRRLIGSNSVADLTWHVDFIRANHWKWTPEFFVQSYADLTPLVDHRNAMQIEKNGPRYLTLRWDQIDGRHPFLSEPATWQSIFDRYDLALADSDLFVLTRRRDSRLGDAAAAGKQVSVHWNELIPLPEVHSDQLLVMRAVVPRTLWGSVKGFLFRNDPVYLEATYTNGRKSKFRVTRANLVNGAIISDLPRSLFEALPLLGYKEDDTRVTAIRWLAEDSSELGKTITISWSTLRLKCFEDTPPPFRPVPAVNWNAIWLPGQPIKGSSGALTANETTGLAVYPNNTDPQVSFAASDLGDFKTLRIKARFSVADQINVFFGRESDGRGYGGYVPVTDEWQDVLVNLTSNRFWTQEAGEHIRFDPSTNKSIGAKIEIAGVWGSRDKVDTRGNEILVVPSWLTPSPATSFAAETGRAQPCAQIEPMSRR